MYNNNKTNIMHLLLPLPVACFAFRLIVGKRVLYYWAGGKLMSRNK